MRESAMSLLEKITCERVSGNISRSIASELTTALKKAIEMDDENIFFDTVSSLSTIADMSQFY